MKVDYRYVADEEEVTILKCNSCSNLGSSGISCSHFGEIPASILDGAKCDYYEVKK